MTTTIRSLAIVTIAAVGLSASVGLGDDPPKFNIAIKEGAVISQDVLLPVDPQVRVNPQHMNNIYFGITVDNFRITCSPQGSIWPATMIDGVMQNPANGGQQMVMRGLPKSSAGKERRGFMGNWKTGALEFTQTVEIVPSKPVNSKPGAKRRMDTCRISYLVENKDSRPHELAFRTNVDILINNNDGALFASPVTHPDQVLNGVVLEGKTFPPFLQVLERPNVKDPGCVGVMTFNFGTKTEGPYKIVLTQLGAVGAGWDVPAMQAGDSACAIYWQKKTLKPGEKRDMVWAYGGGIATNPENDGRVIVNLGGNLEPGKLFTISAMVEDPVPSQTLELELPAGVERVDGAQIEPIPTIAGSGYGMVMWRGRVTKAGDYDIRVRSSTGVTQTKTVSIQPIGGQ